MITDEMKYPIGRFEKPETIEPHHIADWVDSIEALPLGINEVINGLTDEQLDWRYRPEGWTIRQLVHHVADSHMNSFIRFKLALTEDTPSIKPYFENLWALTADVQRSNILDSIKIIEGLHARWTVLLKNLKPAELKRGFFHPEYQCTFSVEEAIGMYAWHSNHHLAHIMRAVANDGAF
ncbi:MAG: putative metal-dependent hydrolase [Candidatus Zixiibacteriota bacterium]